VCGHALSVDWEGNAVLWSKYLDRRNRSVVLGYTSDNVDVDFREIQQWLD
jgi:hypothetical protein